MLNTDSDAWELFVPVEGDVYPPRYEYSDRYSKGWVNGLYTGEQITRRNISTIAQYRKPKQKENKVSDRTPQQALKDAIASGAVEAWINGEDTQYSMLSEGEWNDCGDMGEPRFAAVDVQWRPKPPEPTKIDWKPVVTGKEPKGIVLGFWPQGRGGHSAVHAIEYTGSEWVDESWRDDDDDCAPPTHWAPMCNLPEGDK